MMAIVGVSLAPSVLARTAREEYETVLLEKNGGIDGLLAMCKRAGAESVEMHSIFPGTSPKTVEDCMRPILNAGMRASVHGVLTEQEPEEQLAQLETVWRRNKGRTVLNIHVVEGRGDMTDEKLTYERLPLLLEYIQKNRLPVDVALENNRLHAGQTFYSDTEGIAEIGRRIGSYDGFGFCFDMGHHCSDFQRFPERTKEYPPEDFLSRVIHTHIHGVVNKDTHFPLNAENLPLKEYLTLLRKYRYPGIYNVELDPRKFYRETDPTDGILSSVRFLKKVLGEGENT